MFLDEKKSGEVAPDLGGLRVDRILALAAEIEKPTMGLHLYMGSWCGTHCCIAGHADAMFCESKGISRTAFGNDGPERWAPVALALGLDEERASSLFVGYGASSDIDPPRAARVLRHLAATGRVDWSIK